MFNDRSVWVVSWGNRLRVSIGTFPAPHAVINTSGVLSSSVDGARSKHRVDHSLSFDSAAVTSDNCDSVYDVPARSNLGSIHNRSQRQRWSSIVILTRKHERLIGHVLLISMVFRQPQHEPQLVISALVWHGFAGSRARLSGSPHPTV